MNLRIPGPIPVPDDILHEMSRPMINHRGPEFKEMLYRVSDRLKQVFDTRENIYILTASGTGALEAAVVNTLSPGDKVLCTTIGSFGDRFAEIAERFGADITTLGFPLGTAVDVEQLRSTLEADDGIKAVLVTHNETSTGVTNDLESIANVVKGEFDKLLLVDGISSVCSIPLHTDAWRCDVIATASQKGWMLPPGLAFISFSKRAWRAHAEAKMPRFYFDLAQYQHYFEIGQPPYTPSISMMFALDLALERIIDEGLDSLYERHTRIGKFTRSGLLAQGLELFANERVASDTVTAFKIPNGIDATELMNILQNKYQIVVATGQESLKGKIIRIGHMGHTTEAEIQDVLDALAETLPKLGFTSPATSMV